MDGERAQRQLRMIGDAVAMSERLGVQIWLRGGWATDFFLGQVTRDHIDIDWEAWMDDAPAITAALHADGYQTIPGPPPDRQLDVAKDGEEMSFGWLARGPDGKVLVAGGPYAGEPWPDGMLDWPPGRIGSVECPIISPHVQIESKEMMPIWVPGRPRRQKDADDIARLRQALQSRQPGK
ncbi:MAG: nucleotidyltransferase domain-containing protein [Streptosporangiaceae bacterium]